MVCGKSEAAHTEPAEVIAGRAILADFQNTAHEFTVGTLHEVDWLTWSLRLGQHLQQLIDAIARQDEPGGVWLTAADVAIVRRALFHAAADERVAGADGVDYDSLRFRLGDDR